MAEISRTLDPAGGNPTGQDWLNAIEMAGYFYEYLEKPSEGKGGIYGIYHDFEHTDLWAVIVVRPDGAAGGCFVPA